MGTINLLEAVRASPSVRVVVAVTSDKCYANPWRHLPDGGTGTEPAPRPFVETDPKGGSDPYSSSKACAELVVESLSAVVLRDILRRPAAGVGTRRKRHRRRRLGRGPAIPDIMRGAITGDAIAVRSPQAVRPWQHVLSPLSGYLRLADWGLDEALSSIVAWYLALRDGADMRAVTLGQIEQFVSAPRELAADS